MLLLLLLLLIIIPITWVTAPVDSTLNADARKAVILTFDDNYKSEYDFALPILEKYGFNATFFVYCDGIDGKDAVSVLDEPLMTSQQLMDIHKRGFDIEAHSVSHLDLVKDNITDEQLYKEVAQADDCIEKKVPGLNISIYATPKASGADNETILKAIQDAGYDYARAGYSDSFDLKCDASDYVPANQTAGCQLFDPGHHDRMKVQNKYNIPTSNMNGLSRDNGHDLNKTQTAFIAMLNEHVSFDDMDNQISIPVLVYHSFSKVAGPPDFKGPDMLEQMFRQQMDYLYANNYHVLSMKDLHYNNATGEFELPWQ